MHRKHVYNQWCYIYSGLLYNQMRTHIASSPRRQLGRHGSLWHSRGLQIGSVVLPTMRQGIDNGHCAFPFDILSKCLGGTWQTAQLQSSTNMSLFSPHIRASLMLAHLLKPLPLQASMNGVAFSNTIALSACVSPIACSGSLAVLAT